MSDAIFTGDPVFIAKAEAKIYQGDIVDLSGSKPLSGYQLTPDYRLLDAEGNDVPVGQVSAGVSMNTADIGQDVIVNRCWIHPQPVFAVQL